VKGIAIFRLSASRQPIEWQLRQKISPWPLRENQQLRNRIAELENTLEERITQITMMVRVKNKID
jgi:hypothetical protein